LIVRAWTSRSVRVQGRHYKVQYVNLWPRPYQKPHRPIWIPSQGSKETIDWAAHPDRRYTYLQTFSPANVVQALSEDVPRYLQGFGYEAQDSRLGWAVLYTSLPRTKPRAGKASRISKPSATSSQDAGRDAAAPGTLRANR